MYFPAWSQDDDVLIFMDFNRDGSLIVDGLV